GRQEHRRERQCGMASPVHSAASAASRGHHPLAGERRSPRFPPLAPPVTPIAGGSGAFFCPSLSDKWLAAQRLSLGGQKSHRTFAVTRGTTAWPPLRRSDGRC